MEASHKWSLQRPAKPLGEIPCAFESHRLRFGPVAQRNQSAALRRLRSHVRIVPGSSNCSGIVQRAGLLTLDQVMWVRILLPESFGGNGCSFKFSRRSLTGKGACLRNKRLRVRISPSGLLPGRGGGTGRRAALRSLSGRKRLFEGSTPSPGIEPPAGVMQRADMPRSKRGSCEFESHLPHFFCGSRV